ncbi:hypothetical protein RhiirA4_486966, partial [Rhizophagus irregularis]
KGTDEILGGYNPLKWESSKTWGHTKDSFIFSFKEKDVKSVIISNIVNTSSAVFYRNISGPRFGDIIIYSDNGESKDYDCNFCKKSSYEREIRDTEDQFSIEDYEVFQIIKR